MEHEQQQQATQINAANQPARRYSRRVAGLEADPPTELKKVCAKRDTGAMEHEQQQQATQINAANQPARRYSRRLAGFEADPPTELKKVRAKRGAPKSQRKRSRKQAHPCRFIKEEVPPSDGEPKGPEAIPLTEPPSDEAAQKLEMGDFWNDPLFETTLTHLDDLSGDISPPPSTSNARVL